MDAQYYYFRNAIFPPPPESIEILLERALALENYHLHRLAQHYRIPIPDLQRAKGWMGQFLERLLGASSGSLPQPDFPHLGVELKSIPMNEKGPLESTYVCTAPLPFHERDWQYSTVARKLHTVLWIPLYTKTPTVRIGKAILWRRPTTVTQLLQQDWELLTEKLRLGQFHDLSAHLGEILQLRPKAENSTRRIRALSEDLEVCPQTPRGFYLRRNFTAELIKSEKNDFI